ncbi:hypothetical protein EDC04DRAFT_2652719 [Pisolithus marmoratus]|nr:hypothetical protein EDC04DRAFT_2652719 [Pisolithus marmoratus]
MVAHSTAPANGIMTAIVFENLTDGFHKSRMHSRCPRGTVLYDEDTLPDKEERVIRAAASTTSLHIGGRLTGFQVYPSVDTYSLPDTISPTNYQPDYSGTRRGPRQTSPSVHAPTRIPIQTHPDITSRLPRKNELPAHVSDDSVEDDEEEELEVADIRVSIADAHSDFICVYLDHFLTNDEARIVCNAPFIAIDLVLTIMNLGIGVCIHTRY